MGNHVFASCVLVPVQARPIRRRRVPVTAMVIDIDALHGEWFVAEPGAIVNVSLRQNDAELRSLFRSTQCHGRSSRPVVLSSKVWNFPALHSSWSSASLASDTGCFRLWISWYLALLRSADSCLLPAVTSSRSKTARTRSFIFASLRSPARR
jgi:hypothetical protein